MFVFLPRHCMVLFPVRLCAVFAGCMLTISRETKQKTLEEIAAAFGDRVVLPSEAEIAAEEAVMEDKAATGHVERASSGAKGV